MAAPYRIVTYRGVYCLAYGKPVVRRSLSTNDLGIAEARAKKLWATRDVPKSDTCIDL